MHCPACQSPNPEGSNFCNACGTRLLPAPAQAPRDPRAYTPAHLARRILHQRSAVEGERKQVTVLFVDLKGSVELSAGLDPEDWHRIMDRFFELWTSSIHRFEGTVNQYTGDGIMALFGAPLAHEDHAQRACHAALHLAEATRHYAQQLRRERGLDFHVRMGMNSGDVVVGRIGDDLRMDYTAQGAVVGLAARMQQIAEAGRIYVASDTAQRVAGYFEFEDLGPFNIRGAHEPVIVSALTGVGGVKTRLDLARARGFSPFVGRTDELRALEAALEAAARGERPVVGLEAGPGLGKSRLCFEWLAPLRERGVPVHEVQCVSHRRMVAFAPLLRLLRDLLGVAAGDDDEAVRDRIAGRLVRLDPALTASLPALFEFLGVPDPERQLPPLDPEARERDLVELTRRLVCRHGDGPAVVLFEDLHWIDEASDVFLARLIERCAGERVVFVTNFRPEYRARGRAGWMDDPGYRAIRLAPLGDAAADALLLDLLGDDASLGDLAARIRDHTRGNPFFIEEVVRALVDDGHLSGGRGAYRARQPIPRLGIPGTLQALLAARIDRLPEREKRVLQDAAVLGRRFPEAALRRVVGDDAAQLAEALRGLLEGEFLYEESLHPQLEYAFQHGLTHQVALSTQLSARRREVHRRAALAREEIHADHPDEHAALVAHHWESARDRPRAAAWHRRAAVWAGVNHAPESLAHWQSVRDLLGDRPGDAEQRALAAEARGQLIMAIGRMGGELAEADRLFAEGEALLGDAAPASAARMRLHYAHFNTMSGRADAAERVLDGLDGEGADGDPAVEAARRYLRPMPNLLVRGELHGVVADLEETIAFAHAHPGAGAEVLGFAVEPLAVAWLGYACVLEGRLAEGRARLEDAIAFAGAGHPGAALQAINCGLALADLLLDAPTALAWGRRCVDVAASMGFGQPVADISYGRACLRAGAVDDALACFERGLGDTLASHSYAYQEVPFRVALARARFARGDTEGSMEAAECAVAQSSGRGFYAADARLVRALARLSRGDPDGAADDARAADDLARAGGTPTRTPYALRIQAACAAHRGDADASRSLRADADRAERALHAGGAR
ncbi:MAG: adenylate/guanylate cyclase domain-containing protein [Myxococcota bacterium]